MKLRRFVLAIALLMMLLLCACSKNPEPAELPAQAAAPETHDLDAKGVGEFTGTFEIDASSATPILLTSAGYSPEPIKGAFGKNADGAFCIRVKLNTAVVEGELKSVVTELTAKQ